MVVAADSVQMDPQGLQRVEEIFREQIGAGLHPGAALAVYRHGQPVLDLHGGLANRDEEKPVASDTMFVLYSCTKGSVTSSLRNWFMGRPSMRRTSSPTTQPKLR